MAREYNTQAFTPEEVEKGLLKDLLDYLIDYNKKCESGYYDIHICSDGYCTIVEWIDIDYKYEAEQGKFEFVPSNGQVMLEYSFPDNHYEQFYNEEEYQERFQEWLKENPGWVKTPYGTWTNEIENEKYRKMLEEEKSKDDND